MGSEGLVQIFLLRHRDRCSFDVGGAPGYHILDETGGGDGDWFGVGRYPSLWDSWTVVVRGSHVRTADSAQCKLAN